MSKFGSKFQEFAKKLKGVPDKRAALQIIPLPKELFFLCDTTEYSTKVNIRI